MTVYDATAGFPKEEVYGLTSQMRRAAVSIPSNIAEGQGRRTDRDFCHFLSIAHGSVREVETQTLIAHRLADITEEKTSALLDSTSSVGRLINGLANSLSRRQ